MNQTTDRTILRNRIIAADLSEQQQRRQKLFLVRAFLESGGTGEQVAALLGVSRGTVYRWLKSESPL